MTTGAGATTALIVRNLKQITELLGVEKLKHAASRGFLATATPLVNYADVYQAISDSTVVRIWF